MRYGTLLMLVFAVGCSGSPTSPTPIPPPAGTPPVVVVPPPVVPPPVVTPSLPTSDPRFDLAFYRMFAHNGYEEPTNMRLLWRQQEAPRVYLRTIDDNGRTIDALTLNATQDALENVAGKLTGKFGLAGLERGTETRQGQKGWITVRWTTVRDSACARATVGGDLITMYLTTSGCRCVGGPAIAPLIVKHELGHALGFWHTDQRTDLMHGGQHGLPACDMDPSPREQFHAAAAYNMPFNSFPP